jgi:hypothetical protein
MLFMHVFVPIFWTPWPIFMKFGFGMPFEGPQLRTSKFLTFNTEWTKPKVTAFSRGLTQVFCPPEPVHSRERFTFLSRATLNSRALVSFECVLVQSPHCTYFDYELCCDSKGSLCVHAVMGRKSSLWKFTEERRDCSIITHYGITNVSRRGTSSKEKVLRHVFVSFEGVSRGYATINNVPSEIV